MYGLKRMSLYLEKEVVEYIDKQRSIFCSIDKYSLSIVLLSDEIRLELFMFDIKINKL